MEHNQGRRGHFHRGRRGPDRRGPDRRQGLPPEQPNRAERVERVDVEQIMREIRSRIAQRSGIDLTNQQIHELAARRLEAILDPRGLKPELLEQLRRSAGERTVSVDAAAPNAAESYPFDEASLYDSPNGFLRFLRKLFKPCAAKYQRYTAAGIPIVTTTRAVLPRSRGVQSCPRASNANPGRSTCSRNALTIAGISPSHSG